MKAVAEIIISLFELAEAEGRELRRNVLILLAVGASFFTAAVLAIAGILALLFALYRVMLPHFGEAVSLAAAGAVCVSASLAVVVSGFKYVNKSLRREDGDDEQPEEPNEPQEECPDSGAGEGEAAAIDGERRPVGGH
ncbi:MAG: hypothetical protein LBS45_05610 [Synergistaceae bacterium]|nr:hypothetical protein [Synergistaceae bacterium]